MHLISHGAGNVFLRYLSLFRYLTVSRSRYWPCPGISEWASGDDGDTAAFEELLEKETRAARRRCGFPSPSSSDSPKHLSPNSPRAEGNRPEIRRWGSLLLFVAQAQATDCSSGFLRPKIISPGVFFVLVSFRLPSSLCACHPHDRVAAHPRAEKAKPTAAQQARPVPGEFSNASTNEATQSSTKAHLNHPKDGSSPQQRAFTSVSQAQQLSPSQQFSARMSRFVEVGQDNNENRCVDIVRGYEPRML